MVEEIWKNFLNPDVLRKRLLTSGLYLIAFEFLMDSIQVRLKDFFSDSWTSKSDFKPSPKYKDTVLSLDPKGKGDVLRGSLEWLQNMEAISKEDCENFWRLKRARNSFAHELRHLAGSGRGPDFERLFPELLELLVKIDRWWILNVEIATDPEFSEREVVEDEITPSSLLMLQIAQKVALGDDDEAWDLYNQFSKSV